MVSSKLLDNSWVNQGGELAQVILSKLICLHLHKLKASVFTTKPTIISVNPLLLCRLPGTCNQKNSTGSRER